MHGCIAPPAIALGATHLHVCHHDIAVSAFPFLVLQAHCSWDVGDVMDGQQLHCFARTKLRAFAHSSGAKLPEKGPGAANCGASQAPSAPDVVLEKRQPKNQIHGSTPHMQGLPKGLT